VAAPETHLWAFFQLGDGSELRKRPIDDCRYLDSATIEPGRWAHVLIPLADLRATGQWVSRVSFQDRTGEGGAFWVDEIRLAAARWRANLPVIEKP
jgi:hypothetical protein